jgi:ABC-type transport system substrate-binding protein
LVTLLLTLSFAVFPVRAPARSDAVIRFYSSADAGYAALVANDVEFIQWSLTHEQRLAAEANPNLCVASFTENGMWQLDLNNNYTVPLTYPGIRNPLNDQTFRQALSCAVDKQYIVDEILLGDGRILNVPISLNSISWWNSCLHQANFAWKYNITKAGELLDAAGFDDRDDNGVRNYPVGWDGAEAGGDMDPLYVCIRSDDMRYDVGLYFCSQLGILDVPYEQVIGTSDVLFPIVMHDRNYHVYTGGWSLGRYSTFLYFGYHSGNFWFPDGQNYVTGMNKSGMPNYPKLDQYLEDIYYALSIEVAKDATLKAGGYGWCDLVVNIPLWSYKSFVAWRKTLAGVVNMAGYGLENKYTFSNAYRIDRGPIRMGAPTLNQLNPLYSTWESDYAVLDRVFDTLLSVNPYDLAVDQPWAAQDWEVGTWIDANPGPGEPSTKSMVTYYLRKNLGIVEPGTGSFVRNLTAHDLEFSCWYTYAFYDGWNWGDYQDVHHSEIIDDYTIKFYFDDASCWFATAPQYPILCKNELINPLCGISSASFASDGSNCTAGTQFKLPTNEQRIQVTSDDLTVDYVIFGGYQDWEHNWIWLQGDLPAGTYTITYYTPDVDPYGYYLAGLPWQDTWYGFGMFYPIDMVPGVGGYAIMNKNPYYFLETPLLGETDWRWWWDTLGGVPGSWEPGRDTGCFKIDVYDVVKATASYCHRGDGDFDTDYFPSADLDPSDLGHIGIYDIVTITGKYGQEWAHPPP